METYAYFDNIHKHISKELSQTIFDVTAAIAWFTDEDIYELLCKKAVQNVSVRVLLIKDQINTWCAEQRSHFARREAMMPDAVSQ